jgi:hypothetical protein
MALLHIANLVSLSVRVYNGAQNTTSCVSACLFFPLHAPFLVASFPSCLTFSLKIYWTFISFSPPFSLFSSCLCLRMACEVMTMFLDLFSFFLLSFFL